jgi:hypothetical protein
MKDDYFIMDLERTLISGVPCFWKGNRYGYTYNLQHAGVFPKEKAEEIANNDRNQRTVIISLQTVFEILGKDMKAHEGD